MKTLLTTLTSLLLSASISFAAIDFTSGFTIDGGYDTVGSTADGSGISFSAVIGVTGGTVSGFWDTAQDASDFSGAALEILGSMTASTNVAFDLVFYDSAFNTATVSGASTGLLTTNVDSGAAFAWNDISAVDLSLAAADNVSVSGALTGIAAVPEPSTYALLAGFAAFIFVAVRRRNS